MRQGVKGKENLTVWAMQGPEGWWAEGSEEQRQTKCLVLADSCS